MFADRMSPVQVSATLKVAAEAERLRRAGHSVVDFSAGEPDFPTPEHVKAAAKAAIDANFTRYTAAAGIPELREAICARYKRDYGVDITAAEVLLTVGGKQALFNTALALFNPGDEVITHAPYWPTIPEQVKLVGARAGHRADELRATASACRPRRSSRRSRRRRRPSSSTRRAIPTGALIEESAVAAIADEAARRGIWIDRRPLLRAADLRDGAAQPAEGAVRSASRQDGAVRVGVEELRHDRLALRLDDCAEGADLGLQHHPGAVHVEHHVDHAEGGAGGHLRARRTP